MVQDVVFTQVYVIVIIYVNHLQTLLLVVHGDVNIKIGIHLILVGLI